MGPAVGVEVVTNVQTFVARLDKVADHDGGPAALALLGERGLDSKQIDAARDLLARLEAPQPNAAEDSTEANARYKEAENAMWDYYLEWSAIARATIRSKRDLKRLGFSSESVQDGSH